MQRAFFITLLTLAAAFSAAALGHSYYFSEGGLDPFGYTYWTTTLPDSKPLALVRAGQKKEAFEYCLAKIDGSSGKDRVFYIVQASGLGYGLKRPHEVAAVMAAQVNKKVGLYDSASALDRVSAQDWLLYAYSYEMCNLLASEPDNKYDSWGKMSQQRAFRFSPEALDIVAKTNYRGLEDRYLKATWAFNADHYDVARKLMTGVAEEMPNQPGAHLTACRYWTHGPSNEAANSQKAHALLVDIRKRWPNYDRAIYFDGVYGTRYKDPQAAKRLLETYIKMNTGPKFEIESAKRTIATIEKG
jgi:hypothetical protein